MREEVDKKVNLSQNSLRVNAMTQEERKLAFFVSNLVNDKKTINDNLKPLENSKELTHIKWDRKSPRFMEAQMSLGIIDDDLTLRYIEEFAPGHVDNQVGRVRFAHHRKSLMQLLN